MAIALHVAHGKGVLHRDVKPHNIFRSRYGDPALGDFGIATVDGERGQEGTRALTVAYAAPELIADTGAGTPVDIYALSATLHHLASGAPPFHSDDLRTTIFQIVSAEPPAIGRADLPSDFERVLRAGMAKDPVRRPATALVLAEMLAEVQRLAGHQPTVFKLEPGQRASSRPAPAAPSGTGIALRPPGTPSAAPPAAPATAPPATPATAPQAGPAARTPARMPAEDGSAEVSGRRRRTAAGAVVAAVLLVIAGVIAFGFGDESGGGEPSPSSSTAPPVDSFLDVIAAPADVAVTAVAGGFTVDIGEVVGATSYLITPTSGDAEPVSVAADALPARFGPSGAPGGELCVVVAAAGAGGRVSRDAGPFCSTG